MAKIQKWRGCHVKVETLEKIMGIRLSSFRDMYHFDIEGEDILNNSADWFKIPKEGYYVNKNYIMYIKEEC